MNISGINSANFLQYFQTKKDKTGEVLSPGDKTDKVEISNTARVFNKVDSFLNVSAEGRFDLAGLSKMNGAEREEFLSMLSTLLQKGIVGYEELEVDGKKEKHYIINQIGNERLKGAKPWDDRHHKFSHYDDK